MPIALAALRSRVPPVFTEIAVAPKVPPGVVVLRGLGGVLTERPSQRLESRKVPALTVVAPV